MTPAEKAEELKEKCDGYACYADVAVDEIIRNAPKGFYSGIRPDYKGTDLEYWLEVKQKINRL
jgi:hypothetical protein